MFENIIKRLLGNAEIKPILITEYPHAIVADAEQKVIRLPVIRAAPHRTSGTVTVRKVRDFIDLMNQQKTVDTRAFASISENFDTLKVDGIVNFHGAAAAQFCDYRISLVLDFDPQFEQWIKNLGKEMSQTQFAAFIEDNASTVVQPDAAGLVKMAMQLEGTVNAKFVAKRSLDRGDVTLHYSEEQSAGDVTVPSTLSISLPVFLGGTVSFITIRIGYKVQPGGNVVFWLRSPELKKVLREAAESVISDIKASTMVDVWTGECPTIADVLSTPEVISAATIKPGAQAPEPAKAPTRY